MANPTKITLDASTMTLMAGLATCVAANLMANLFNNGVIDERDIEKVIADTALGGLGDPSLDAMALAMATALRVQINTRLH